MVNQRARAMPLLSSRRLLLPKARVLTGTLLAFSLSLLMIAGALLTGGCQKVPLKEDIISDYEAARVATPMDFQVIEMGSTVTWEGKEPVLTLLLLVNNPNDFPRVFRSMRVELYDERGRQMGFRTWTTQRSPFIMSANSTIPLAVSFTGIAEWQTARTYFTGVDSPDLERVYQGLQALRADPFKADDSMGTAITVYNAGTSAATDVTVLAAGYDSEGKLVAWAPGRQQWHTINAGSTSTLETDAFQGDLSQVTTVKAYLSAYKG
jgi:hypothetical protein